MFKKMTEQQTILALIVAENWENFSKKISELKVKPLKGERKFSFIGTGDLAFPIIFSVSTLLRQGLINSCFVILGATLGFAFCNWLLLKQKRPLPGLPFISLGCLVGFIVGLIV